MSRRAWLSASSALVLLLAALAGAAPLRPRAVQEDRWRAPAETESALVADRADGRLRARPARDHTPRWSAISTGWSAPIGLPAGLAELPPPRLGRLSVCFALVPTRAGRPAQVHGARAPPAPSFA